MRKIILSLAVAFGMQAGAQTIDTVITDTLLYRHFDDGTVDTASISTIDSMTFGYSHDTIWVSSGGCSGGLTSLTYNGYTYDLVEIGGQCWFKENLQTTTYKDGTPIGYPGTDNTLWQIDTTGAYAWYDNDSTTSASTYGALYNWYAVDNSAGLCPTGWHVPSDSAWLVLDSFLAHNGFNYDGSTTGNKYAKAMADTVGWTSNGGIGTVGNTDYPTYRNKSGFSGLPGGVRTGYYANIGNRCNWWSHTQGSSSGASKHTLSYSSYHFSSGTTNKIHGFSVRCLRD